MTERTRPRDSDAYSIRAIERAIRILLSFSFNQNEHTLGELAAATTLSKSTVFRILQTLGKHKFVSYNPTSNRYSLGIRLFELGGVVLTTLTFRKVASKFLDHLSQKGEHTVLTGILEGGELVYMDKRERNDAIKLTSEIGKRRPPHFGMLGKTLMAYLPEKEVDDLLRRYPLEKIAPRAITDPKLFKEHLKEIRDKGYTHEYNEAVEGMIGIAAPVRDYQGQVIAALGVTFPSFKTDDRKTKETVRLVTETAREISVSLGFREVSEKKHRR